MEGIIIMKIPKYAHNKQIGNIAADTLKSILQKFAIVNPHDESIDLGIDMRGQIVENEIPQEQFFNIQCKGTDEADITSSTLYLTIQIKVSTINYWNQQNEVTFLFLVDNSTQNCYWCNPLEQIESRIDEIQEQDKVNIRVPIENCINKQTLKLPSNFINDITLYVVKKMNRLSDMMHKIKNSIIDRHDLDISSSFEILSILVKETDKIKKDYYEIADIIINNIKLNLQKSYDIYHQLDCIPEARRYCPNGVFYDKGFSGKSNKSIIDLKEEADYLISKFESDKSDIEILKELELCEKELKDIYNHVLGFLLEMVREDDPYGDHSDLENMFFKELGIFQN